MRNLGNMFEFAVCYARYNPDEVFSLFVSTGIAESFGSGNPRYIVGRSGQELFCDILSAAKKPVPQGFHIPTYKLSKSHEYWCGWILAYYQWFYNADFKDIRANLSFQILLDLYPNLHEADRQKAVEVLRERIAPKSHPTKLYSLRKQSGLSQTDLATLAGVTLRSIKMYEQRNKDINKARTETLRALSKALCCSIEELLES
jgi:DNA-binding transcriptional regulator YiaG